MSYELVPNQGSAPPNAAVMGHQADAGDMCVGVANTQWGNIPGKAQGNTCWFPYGEKEHTTTNFSWLVAPHYAISLERNTGSPPAHALALGEQNDGTGVLYIAVARSEVGRVPGKAKDNSCWFPYGGKENVTDDFDWVVLRPQ